MQPESPPRCIRADRKKSSFEVMLRGSRQDVVAAARKAIDDAGAGGRFIPSTGDQCGRDTPDENLRALVETARTYGR